MLCEPRSEAAPSRVKDAGRQGCGKAFLSRDLKTNTAGGSGVADSQLAIQLACGYLKPSEADSRCGPTQPEALGRAIFLISSLSDSVKLSSLKIVR